MIGKLNEYFREILEFAERNQKCKRKAVGCAALTFTGQYDVPPELRPMIVQMAHNGPSREGHECTNEVGNCGCSHSEPRLVRNVLQEYVPEMPLILLCTYSPCTNCANIIIDSKQFCGVIYHILTEHDTRGEKFLREAMPVATLDELNTLTERDLSDKIKSWIFS
jgi:deoxycytidylate deaminase